MSNRTIDWCIHCPLAECDEGAAGCLLTGPDLARRRQAALAASLAEWASDVRPHVLPRVFPDFGARPSPCPSPRLRGEGTQGAGAMPGRAA